jgi:hypothetical protein
MAKKNDAPAQNVKIDLENMQSINFGEVFGENVESKLKWKPRPELGDRGLGHLIGAELVIRQQSELDENGVRSSWEYAGLAIPSLKLTFQEQPTKEDPFERFYEHYFTVFTNVKKDGTVVKRSDIFSHYEREYKQLRHIANAFKTNANYDQNAKVADLSPFIENPAERLENLTKYFQSWATLLSGKDGKGFGGQLIWLVLIASSTGTYYTLPSYVGQGFIEKFVENRKPSIEVPINQTTILKGKDKADKATKGGGNSESAAGGAPVPSEINDLVNRYR